MFRSSSPIAPPIGGYPPGLVGVVTGELLRYAQFVTSLHAMRLPAGSAIGIASGLEVSANCNKLIEYLLDSDGEWVLFLGDDQEMLPDTAQRLLEAARDHKLDAVCPLILRRTPPWQTVAYMADPAVDPTPWVPTTETGVVEVVAAGTGGMLVRRHVFEKLDKPWFRVGQIDPAHYQEDVEFCARVRAAGFRIGLDLDTPMGHITPMTVWPARDPAGRHVVALTGRNGVSVAVNPEIVYVEKVPA